MYIPTHFEVADDDKSLNFIQSNAFGQLISMLEGRPVSSHIPFFYDDERRSLICHLARDNPQWEGIEGQETLVTFQGPHDYVSPSWYETRGVPTWNYQAVHIYGHASLITETSRLKSIVETLTRIHESSLESPWEPKYQESMLAAIIGVEIRISEIQCKYKLGQNRSKEDRRRVIEQLRKQGAVQLAAAMERESHD